MVMVQITTGLCHNLKLDSQLMTRAQYNEIAKTRLIDLPSIPIDTLNAWLRTKSDWFKAILLKQRNLMIAKQWETIR